MSRMTRLFGVTALALGLANVASAQGSSDKGFDTGKLFFGGGLASNDLDGALGFNSGWNSATGFQFFGGYSFGEVSPKLGIDVEVGYMDTGTFKNPRCGAQCNFSADGLWSNAVARYALGDNVELVGRAGLDFGDDDGLMFGFGGGFLLSPKMTLGAAYVIRQNINSLQFNITYRP